MLGAFSHSSTVSRTQICHGDFFRPAYKRVSGARFDILRTLWINYLTDRHWKEEAHTLMQGFRHTVHPSLRYGLEPLLVAFPSTF